MAEAGDLRFDLLRDDIYAEVASSDEVASYPSDTIYLEVSEELSVAFIIDLCYTDGSRFRWPITPDHLRQWKLSTEELFALAGAKGSVVPVSRWHRISRFGRAYSYPGDDRDWTAHLLRTNDLETMGLRGVPVIMIPNQESMLVTGAHDWLGIRAIRSFAHEITATPLTPRMLMLKNGRWVSFGQR